MIGRVLSRIGVALSWFGAFALFVLSPAIGSISSIIGVVAAALLLPVAFQRGAWRQLQAQPAMLIFLAAFVSLAVCYWATSQHPTDVLLAINFLALPLASVVYLVGKRSSGVQTTAVVSAFLAAGAVVAVLMGGYQVFVEHHARASGVAQGGNLMARTVVLLGFLAMAGVFVTQRRRWWIYCGGLLFSMLALYLTGTRGVFIAVPILGLILVWALMLQLRAPRVWFAAGVSAVIVLAGATAVFSPRFLRLGQLFEQLATNASSVTDSATNQRLYMWSVGIHTFLKSPLIGFGWANFTKASLPYGIYFYHNDFLDMAVAAGVVGIVCWLAIIVAPIIGVFAMSRDRFHTLRLYCALILSASLFIFGLTDMTLGYDLPTTLHAFLTAIVLGAFREPPVGGGLGSGRD